MKKTILTFAAGFLVAIGLVVFLDDGCLLSGHRGTWSK
jgi:hypothetical protein